MVGEDRAQTHCACVQYAFVAQIAERCMAMHNLCLFPNEDLPQQRERAEHRRESGATIDNPVWKVVDFDAVRQISNACS